MNADKTGYLNSDFRMFYLADTDARDFQSHYHDFHKLLILESGSVSYYIEGETYQLQPWDIVLVPAGEVHRPVIHDESPYRRLILYLAPSFFRGYADRGIDLGRCFFGCAPRRSHVLRFSRFQECRLYPQFRELAHAAGEPAPQESSEAALYQRAVLVQFLILLNRAAEGSDIAWSAATGANPQILQALSYINGHLREDLSIDRIADACFLNRSYLMHLFRRETGCTIGSYITEKRLFAARALIQAGIPVTEAGLRSGFSSYAAFYRAWRQKFGDAPKGARTASHRLP